MQIDHHPDLVPHLSEPGVDRYPGGMGLGKTVRVADGDRRPGLCGDGHPERTRLAVQAGPVVVRPDRGPGKPRVQPAADLAEREAVTVRSRRAGHDDPGTGNRQRLCER
jgi:hypothetical protein